MPHSELSSNRPPEATMTEMVFPDHTNHLGTLFGGQALAWMDKAAFIAATRHARRVVVTARSDRVDFHTAVPAGALVRLTARVVATGRSSMQVDVEMHAEDPLRGDCTLATRGCFTMVALDGDGRPTAVPPLDVETSQEAREGPARA
ncbi:acyl-CoA thioesterase [Cognatilysobacter bugurensis]|uniref:Acyl-CoA thioesterase n=1 Tax=Cognatilysobacter bugurensis TaxID=543356 RepID=A0A918T2K6_9GAMM|nr:acyl-CoA thioesterase [Lysobacter bugurensis]GHA84589.1 acyl-CoA thioesterase [Lysobacter bugurensis]